MLDQRIISPSNSDYASRVVLVKKKYGTMRFCVDYRDLNDITIKDGFPLPLIDDLIYSLQGCRYISTFDFHSGFWQIPIAEKDRHKTAFITTSGLYQFSVLPFGLTNSPATYQRMINKVFDQYNWSFVLAYLDDNNSKNI